MEIIDGKRLSEEIKREVKEKVRELPLDSRPRLTLVQVGEDPASSVYVRNKERSCEECGISSQCLRLPESIEERELLDKLEELSDESSVNGILLQLPLPAHIDAEKAISAINPLKDVDGFHPENLGLLLSGKPRFVPCTPLGIREMLLRYRIEVAGKEVVVLGRSLIVGKPLAILLSMKGEGGDATVTVCHSKTRSLIEHTRSADILVAAIGKARFVTGDMVKDNAVVIDVGINKVVDAKRRSGYRLVGDVDFESVSPKAAFITPVPGGVGPMTVAMLMANALRAFTTQISSTNAVS